MPSAPCPAPRAPHTIILRPWPKVVFFYPTMLTAFIVGFWQLLRPPETPTADLAGLIFFGILAANLLVISFEFSRVKTVSIVFFLLALFFLLLYLGTKWQVFGLIVGMVNSLGIHASAPFYLAFGSYLLLIYAGIFLNTRWNYFEVRHNEIVHRTGFLGDIRRFPSPNLKMTKEISDVLEFLLLGSGRIILYPASEKEAIVLDNVLNVNRAEREMKKMLSAIQVEMAHHHEPPRPEDH